MSQSPILIAGGGIAGIASALALARIDRPSIVAERAPGFEAVGAGLQLGPNAVRAMQAIGAWDAMEADAFAPEAIDIRDGLSGRSLLRIPLDRSFEQRFGYPYRVAHRGDLLEALLRTARASNLIELRNATTVAPSQITSAPLVIAADGVRSSLRSLVDPQSAPAFTGQIIFRALIDGSPQDASVILWLCPHGHVVHYPVSGGRRLNLVAVIDGDWHSDEWSGPADRQEVRSAFSQCHRQLTDTLSMPSSWLRWAAAQLNPPATWHRRNIVLVGDAAHACVPYLAQGAAMALEDAVTLAACLRHEQNVSAACSSYETERRSRAQRVARASLQLEKIYHAAGPFRLARNGILALATPQRFLDRLEWIYSFEPPRL